VARADLGKGWLDSVAAIQAVRAPAPFVAEEDLDLLVLVRKQAREVEKWCIFVIT
jgi:hypothetical protein